MAYRFRKESDQITPIITPQKPAPDNVMELVKCGCGIGKCRDNVCSCRRDAFTEMRSCEGDVNNCENTQVVLAHVDSDDDIDDDAVGTFVCWFS